MDMKEIELKLQVPSFERLEDRLKALGYRPTVPFAPEESTLWDRNGALRARGEALRVRSYAGRTLLTWKGRRDPDPILKIRPEVETEVGNGNALEAILRALDLAPAMAMTKVRALWEGPDLTVCLDRTPFGCYVELEGPREVIAQARKTLGLEDAPVETRSYPQLFEAHGDAP